MRFERVLAQGLELPTVPGVLPVLVPWLRLEFVRLLLLRLPLQQHALLRPSLLQWRRQRHSAVKGRFVRLAGHLA